MLRQNYGASSSFIFSWFLNVFLIKCLHIFSGKRINANRRLSICCYWSLRLRWSNAISSSSYTLESYTQHIPISSFVWSNGHFQNDKGCVELISAVFNLWPAVSQCLQSANVRHRWFCRQSMQAVTDFLWIIMPPFYLMVCTSYHEV